MCYTKENIDAGMMGDAQVRSGGFGHWCPQDVANGPMVVVQR